MLILNLIHLFFTNIKYVIPIKNFLFFSSQINVIPLAASTKEWLLKMEDHEEVVLVVASENLVCFAMANYIVRICSVFGTQRAVIAIPGPLVTMAAFKNILMVAYHSAGVRKGDQCINIMLIKFEGKIFFEVIYIF